MYDAPASGRTDSGSEFEERTGARDCSAQCSLRDEPGTRRVGTPGEDRWLGRSETTRYGHVANAQPIVAGKHVHSGEHGQGQGDDDEDDDK